MAYKKVALDCGHGLNTAGKQTPDGIKEWTLNDKVRDKVVKLLKGYDVEFIFPDNDEGSVDESLTKRRTMYVNAKVDAAISIHHNAYTGEWNSATGVVVYTDKNATAKDKALAEAVYSRMVSNIGLRGRGILSANWTVINQNTVPAILTEGGFMDGKNDYKVITSSAGQTAYAKAIADGLIEFLKLKKVSATTVPSTTSTVSITRGAKVVLNNTKVYSTANTTTAYNTKKGTYYIWSTEVVNGRIRVTNLQSRVGVAGQVTGWIDTSVIPMYYSKYTGSSTSIDTILKQIGASEYTGNYKKRKPIASANGISNYTGTSTQNSKLVTLAKSGKLIKPSNA